MQRRIPVLAALTVAAGVLLAPAALAAPPASAIAVSDTTLTAGQTFTVTQTLHNPEDFTVTGAKAALYAKEGPITSLVDLVSCTGTIVTCAQYLSSFRGPVGDLGAGESATVTFTFRLKSDAAPGTFTLQHQFAGDNYAFGILDGPEVTITKPAAADVKLSLSATPHWSLNAEVEYVVTATNAGPDAATAVTLVGTYPANRWLVSAGGCTAGASHTVSCTIAKLASGASTSVRFTTAGSILSWGPFATSVQRKSSTPADPNPANDSASRTCKAYTGVYVTC